MSPQLPTVLLRSQTDERLARLAAAGSERAFEAIVDRYRRPLSGYARRMVGESRAEDVVQAAFVGAWSKLSMGAEVRDLRAWLFRIVHNGAINALRRASASDVELFEDTPSPGDVHGELERREEVRSALDGIASLPAQQRAALLGVAVQGRRHREVGDDLGLTDGAVRMLLHRARSSMRTAATALTPWPLLHCFAGERGAEAAAGGAGAGALIGGGLKAAALISTAAVAVSAAPQISQIGGGSPGNPPGREGQSQVALRAVAGGSAALARRPAVLPEADDKRVVRRRRVRKLHTVVATVPVIRLPVAPPAAGPAAQAPPSAGPAGGALRRDYTVTLKPRPAHDPVFVHPAAEEDDWITLYEEPPDPAAGELPIPADGVPDPIADAALPDLPEGADIDPSDGPDSGAPPGDPAAGADPAAQADPAA